LRPDFKWSRLAHWGETYVSVHVVERRALPPLGLFSLIRFGRGEAAAAMVAAGLGAG
jgi:phosphatidylethanolamine/phosphatidyl-N-methylethanolamine N-methyltransferase